MELLWEREDRMKPKKSWSPNPVENSVVLRLLLVDSLLLEKRGDVFVAFVSEYFNFVTRCCCTYKFQIS